MPGFGIDGVCVPRSTKRKKEVINRRVNRMYADDGLYLISFMGQRRQRHKAWEDLAKSKIKSTTNCMNASKIYNGALL
jgi:hypothetical protein